MLNTAVDDELITRNPCRIRGGGAEHADERPMVAARLVFELAEVITPRLRALVILAGFVGLRMGELVGLRRYDVDLENRRLAVRVQVQQITGAGRVVSPPKSEAGLRSVSIPTVVVEAPVQLRLSIRGTNPWPKLGSMCAPILRTDIRAAYCTT